MKYPLLAHPPFQKNISCDTQINIRWVFTSVGRFPTFERTVGPGVPFLMEPPGKALIYFWNEQEPPGMVLGLFLEVHRFMGIELFIFFKGGGPSSG